MSMIINPISDNFNRGSQLKHTANASTSSIMSTAARSPRSDSQDGTRRLASSTPIGEQKTSRKSRPKVKTGCSNCKQRRIKCDEKRPACSQCVKSRRECTGYPPPPRHTLPAEGVRIAPKLVASAPPPGPTHGTGPLQSDVTLLPRRTRKRSPYLSARGEARRAHVEPSPALIDPSSLTLNLMGIESYYFEEFRSTASSSLSGYFDSSFWTRVLRECHTEPAICHAAIALGALSKSLEESFSSSVAPGEQHWQAAIHQYSKACNFLMLPGRPVHNRVRLMATVLLASFDAFIGDHKQAIVQTQNGLALLKEIHGQQGISKPQDFVEDELVIMLIRQAIQAKSYELAYHFSEPYVIRFGHETCEIFEDSSSRVFPSISGLPLDRPFSSLLEAQLALDQIVLRSMQFIENLQQTRMGPLEYFPEPWMAHGSALQAKIDNWARAFQPLFDSRHTLHIGERTRSALAVLKMSQINSGIILRAYFNSTEMCYDAFMPGFATIVNLAREVLAEEAARTTDLPIDPELAARQSHGGGYLPRSESPAPLKPSFSIDLGIVPPLFIAATKCRDFVLRRRAIRLLQCSSRREGMWDSELSARIGQWVMDMEESGGQAMHDDIHAIPEDRRVTIHSIQLDLRSRAADVTLGTRGMMTTPDDFDPRRVTTRICW